MSKLPLFNGIPSAESDKLCDKFDRLRFKKGQEIVKQGARCREMFLLVQGKVEISCRSAKGSRITILFQEAPGVFGELEVWDGAPNIATVTALEAVTAIRVPRTDFLELMHRHHQVAINYAQAVTRILFKVARDRRVQFFGRVENRLANVLCSLAKMYGEQEKDALVLSKALSNTLLSEMLGVSRKSVVESMGSLEKEGLIRRRGKRLAILNLARLQGKTVMEE